MLDPERQHQERKELADTLRSLRKAAGLSGERLAARCAMSQSKISRIEKGKILPSVTDVQQILAALKVPEDAARELTDLARTANVHYTSYRAVAQVGLWRLQVENKSLAASSAVFRHFQPVMLSGMLQTEGYARRVLTPISADDITWDVERAVTARMDSQQVLHDESRQFRFLMLENAARWRYADSETMAAQCSHMAAMSTKPNIEIAVIPRTTPVVVGR